LNKNINYRRVVNLTLYIAMGQPPVVFPVGGEKPPTLGEGPEWNTWREKYGTRDIRPVSLCPSTLGELHCNELSQEGGCPECFRHRIAV